MKTETTAAHSGSGGGVKGDVDQPALLWAPPPWHTQVIVGILLANFLMHTPAAVASMDEIALPETFSRTLFPAIVPLPAVILFRLFCGTVLVSINIRDFFYGSLDLPTTYYPGSKLKPAIINFRGVWAPGGSLRLAMKMNTSFSSWSVALLGCSFLLNGFIPLIHEYVGWNVSKGWLRLAVLLWTMSAPSALLVSLIVTYVLWPDDVKQGHSTDVYKRPWILLMHTLNSTAALTEVGIMGGIPCRFPQDFASSPMFGMVYILFAWVASHARFWTEDYERDGVQFLYPFFDTTLKTTCSVAIVALFLVFILSFCLFSLAEYVLSEYVGGGIGGHTVAVVVMSAAVCRFRD